MVATGLGLSGSPSVEHAPNVAVLPVSGAGIEPDPIERPSPRGPEIGVAEKAGERNYFDIPAYIRRRTHDGPRV